MADITNVDYEKQQEWDGKELVEAAKRICRARDIPLVNFPDRINLENGGLARTIIDLAQKNKRENPKLEYATVLILGLDDKVRTGEIFMGSEERVTTNVRLRVTLKNANGRTYSDRELTYASIHTHADVDVPPSPVDYIKSIVPPENGGCALNIIITPERVFMIIRSLETDFDGDLEGLKSWVQDLGKGLKGRGVSNIFQQETHQKGISMEICEKYNLVLYVADNLGENGIGTFYKGYR